MIRFEMIIGMWLYRKSNNDGWSAKWNEFCENKLMSLRCRNKYYTRWVCIFTSDQLSSTKMTCYLSSLRMNSFRNINYPFVFSIHMTRIVRTRALSISKRVNRKSSKIEFIWTWSIAEWTPSTLIGINTTHLRLLSSQNICTVTIRHSIENYMKTHVIRTI